MPRDGYCMILYSYDHYWFNLIHIADSLHFAPLRRLYITAFLIQLRSCARYTPLDWRTLSERSLAVAAATQGTQWSAWIWLCLYLVCIMLYRHSLTRANFFNLHQISRVWEQWELKWIKQIKGEAWSKGAAITAEAWSTAAYEGGALLNRTLDLGV